jgi:hypothetical protein
MITRKRAEGEVVYNNGEFAEVDICGIEGVEEGLFLETIQIHVEDTSDTREEFQQKFPIGTWLNIWATTEITPLPADLPGRGCSAVVRSSGTMRDC